MKKEIVDLASKKGAPSHYPGLQGLGLKLALDELFDITLYRSLFQVVDDELRAKLELLIPIEEKQLAFWREFFDIEVDHLNLSRRIKLKIILFLARFFGQSFVYLLLESIEIHDVRKYLQLWQAYKDTELRDVIYKIIDEEFRIEEEIISDERGRWLNGEKIRNIFLGLNDGLVETLGAVSGFFAAFADYDKVLIAGITVAAAGAFSMSAGVYVSSGSQKEIEKIQRRKNDFLKRPFTPLDAGVRPLRQSLIVGIAYLGGSFIPLLPIFIGARSIAASLVSSLIMVSIISYVVAFLSGMKVSRRVALNLAIVTLAVIVTYTVGLLVKSLWGLQV